MYMKTLYGAMAPMAPPLVTPLDISHRFFNSVFLKPMHVERQILFPKTVPYRKKPNRSQPWSKDKAYTDRSFANFLEDLLVKMYEMSSKNDAVVIENSSHS